MSACLLGLDPSPRKLGWGAVWDDTGKSLNGNCGVIELDGSPEAVRDALQHIDSRLAGIEPVLIYAEQAAFSGGLMASFRAGDTFGMVRALARLRWPWAPIYPVQPAQWRKSVHVKGRGRAELKAAALLLATAHDFDHDGSDDAAEGALIARAAWEDGRAGRVWAKSAPEAAA